MWIGTYIKWNPIPLYEGKRFEIEAVHDDWEGFRVWFKLHDNNKPMLIVSFDYPLFYSSSDDGDRLSSVNNDISKEFPHLFWKVENSALVTEFKRQTSGVRNDENITHYCFMSCNQCIDILSTAEPKFSGVPSDV